MKRPLLQGLERALREAVARKRAYVCLFYHRVGDGDGLSSPVNRSTKVTTAAFQRQMQFIKNYCRPLALTEMVARLAQGIPADGFYVAVSFDDGYADNYTEAFPIISNLGIPITLFLATAFIDEPAQLPWWDLLERVSRHRRGLLTGKLQGAPVEFDLNRPAGRVGFFRTWSNHLKRHPGDEAKVREWLHPYLPFDQEKPNDFLRWEQVRRMAASPLVDLAPHTCRHSDLGLAGPGTYEEVRLSRERIREETGAVSDLFSYPFGGYGSEDNHSLFQYLEAQGIKAAFTTSPGTISSNHPRFLLPRIAISGRDSEAIFLLKLWAPDLVGRLQQAIRRRLS